MFLYNKTYLYNHTKNLSLYSKNINRYNREIFTQMVLIIYCCILNINSNSNTVRKHLPMIVLVAYIRKKRNRMQV